MMYEAYMAPGDCNGYFSQKMVPPAFTPPSGVMVTPPPSTGRGRKGKGRSKLTVPKPTTSATPETFGLHTPPESPEDHLDKHYRRVADDETPRSLSDVDEDAEDEEEEEMQDYRYIRYLSMVARCVQ